MIILVSTVYSTLEFSQVQTHDATAASLLTTGEIDGLIPAYSRDRVSHRHSEPWYNPIDPRSPWPCPHDDRMRRIQSRVLSNILTKKKRKTNERGGALFEEYTLTCEWNGRASVLHLTILVRQELGGPRRQLRTIHGGAAHVQERPRS